MKVPNSLERYPASGGGDPRSQAAVQKGSTQIEMSRSQITGCSLERKSLSQRVAFARETKAPEGWHKVKTTWVDTHPRSSKHHGSTQIETSGSQFSGGIPERESLTTHETRQRQTSEHRHPSPKFTTPWVDSSRNVRSPDLWRQSGKEEQTRTRQRRTNEHVSTESEK